MRSRGAVDAVRSERGTTVLAVGDDLERSALVANRIELIDRGRLVEERATGP